MLIAQLRGKLPTETWLNSEDLLTSAVFGTLKNLAPEAFVGVLTGAQPLEGLSPPVLSPPLHWSFWPWWDTCEPDVVVEDAGNLCVIEAKLYSEFGEDARAGSQLRREWSDGARRCEEEGKTLWLVTVTNHATLPADAIRRQLARVPADLSRVCWLSWSEIARTLSGTAEELVGGWREDLAELLLRMGLAPFDGFGKIVEYSLATPKTLPWMDRVVLRGETRLVAGFRSAIRSAGAIDGSCEDSWRISAVGFSAALSAAREQAQKGAAPWQIKLM